MKAIITKYHGPSNVRGSRISASAEGVGRIYVGYPHELREGEEAHRLAAETLANKYGWTISPDGGGMPDQSGYCFVTIPTLTPHKPKSMVNVKQCPACNYTTNQPGDMTRHTKTNHKENQ